MEEIKIGIIGLGYVGLPLGRLFSLKYMVVGYDINPTRIAQLNKGIDLTNEINSEDLEYVLTKNPSDFRGLFCTSNINELKDCNYYIITVPTPIDHNKKPDLSKLYKATQLVSKLVNKGDYIIYESTVYPGVTEEECVPIIEKNTGLKLNVDFYVGYSPERINPGDKTHTVDKILKVTSGSSQKAALEIDNLYKSVITAGTYLASSIKVAEAAKVIENSQRDINIAFVNELSKIFNLLNIDTNEVLKTARTKWNFLDFRPGLVGGHCIGVDPYYLAQKAEELGHHPEIILAGRRINDSMSTYIGSEIIKLMIKNNILIKNSNVLMLGLSFKENCPDIRNTKVIDLINYLKEYEINVDVYDYLASNSETFKEYNINLLDEIPKKKYDAVVIAVAHNKFKDLDLSQFKKNNTVIYDIKNITTETNKSIKKL
ncbi:nucleotide sugar dehydrogenase [Cellulophaga baltica]|uniref:nucleotide sugar dehydrogenase n=1 Tax=Cellulophaga TaxID=104264 RepID=UPI001C0766ED|nr:MULTISPECIES: nucleotide sugar dehydrogenase [Cellulophaga]MBU2996751.1 nucleotide sugar dehydrogenase [Cellulophaga baltica]MDO6768147.1 nucleotide sugar dehydrogenase [Cellulophaga sp. 1_MG-2023]